MQPACFSAFFQLSFPLFEGRGLNPIPAEPMGIAKGAKDTQNPFVANGKI
jgi:hypothetical protein